MRGAWDFYYANHLGKGKDEMAGYQGDTLLHMAVRFKRSEEFIALVLEARAAAPSSSSPRASRSDVRSVVLLSRLPPKRTDFPSRVAFVRSSS